MLQNLLWSLLCVILKIWCCLFNWHVSGGLQITEEISVQQTSIMTVVYINLVLMTIFKVKKNNSNHDTEGLYFSKKLNTKNFKIKTRIIKWKRKIPQEQSEGLETIHENETIHEKRKFHSKKDFWKNKWTNMRRIVASEKWFRKFALNFIFFLYSYLLLSYLLFIIVFVILSTFKCNICNKFLVIKLNGFLLINSIHLY